MKGSSVKNWRVVTAVVAVVFGVIAAIASYFYLGSADKRAQDKTKQVEVLVAKAAIPRGTTGADALQRGLLEMAPRVRSDVPPSARTSAEGVAALVAAANIDEGSIITESNFIARTQLSGDLSSSLDKNAGKQAITLSVDLQHGVAGLIAVNDDINMIVTAKIKDPSNHGDAATSTVSAYLIPGLKVVAIGSSTGNTGSAIAGGTSADTKGASPPLAAGLGQNVGLITVEATPRQAEQIAQVYANGYPVYLTLNPTGFDPQQFKVPAEIVEGTNLFDQPLSVLQRWQASVPKN